MEPTKRYKCTVLSRRRCPSNIGEYVERSCEEFNCYTFPGIREEQCFDSGGSLVENTLFPFSSYQECTDACKNEKCLPTGIPSQRYACTCTNTEPCAGYTAAMGVNAWKQNCDCTQCSCEIEGGNRVCRDSFGEIIPEGANACVASLEECQNSCLDGDCPSWTKWGCSEVEGKKCLNPPPDQEIFTDCVQCTCRDEAGGVVCRSNNNEKLKSGICEFETKKDCRDAQGIYGSCKGQLCVESIRRGNAKEFKKQVVPPANLGVRKIKNVKFSKEDPRFEAAVYDDHFNFSIKGFREGTEFDLVYNVQYPEIFNTWISPVIKYFLDKENSNTEWNEVYFNELINDRLYDYLQTSLNPNLNLIFNNITHATGEKIKPRFFYDGIIRLLVTGKLSEFDSRFYYNIYAAQENSEIVEHDQSVVQVAGKDQVVLGILDESIISADPSKHEEVDEEGEGIKDAIMNIHVPLTDINARIDLEMEGGATSSLYAEDSGVKVTLTDGSDAFISQGSGNLYYVPVDVITDAGTEKVPLELTTDLSKTYLTPVEVLHKVTRLLGEENFMKLNASSVAGQSEFNEDYSGSSYNSNVMYFAIDWSGVSDTKNIESINPLLHRMICPYKRLTDADEIAEHSIMAGLQAVEVFLHHEDPIRAYLVDSSHCELNLTNVDFGAFASGETPDGKIIARSIIPWTLIFVFGRGSEHDPFHQKSKIERIFLDDSGAQRVHRSCELTPHPAAWTSPVLEQAYTFHTYNTYGLGPLGVVKENADTDRTFFTFNESNVTTNVFFEDGGYVSSEPAISIPITRRVVKEIIEDTLMSDYAYTHFTDWDLNSRLTSNEFSELQLEASEFKNLLRSGLFTEGKPLKYIMSGESNTGITSEQTDSRILTEDYRRSLLLGEK